MAWNGMEWSGVAWREVAWREVAWCGVEWSGVEYRKGSETLNTDLLMSKLVYLLLYDSDTVSRVIFSILKQVFMLIFLCGRGGLLLFTNVGGLKGISVERCLVELLQPVVNFVVGGTYLKYYSIKKLIPCSTSFRNVPPSYFHY